MPNMEDKNNVREEKVKEKDSMIEVNTLEEVSVVIDNGPVIEDESNHEKVEDESSDKEHVEIEHGYSTSKSPEGMQMILKLRIKNLKKRSIPTRRESVC